LNGVLLYSFSTSINPSKIIKIWKKINSVQKNMRIFALLN
jgi:hypothetical protein